MLWIVGPVAIDYREYFERHGITYGQFLHTTTEQHGTDVIGLDFTTAATLRRSLKQLRPGPAVTAVMVTGLEPYVVPAAIIAKHFGVPGLPLRAAKVATDKILMRQKLMAYDPAITPAFVEVGSWQDAENFLREHPGPAMLKPANLMKSLFVTRNSSLGELRQHYRQMMDGLGGHYAEHRLGQPRVLIESCLEGSMHTVAGFVDAAGTAHLADQIADCVTARDVGSNDSFIYARSLPTRLGPPEVQSLLEVTRAGVAALGLRNTSVHAELMLTTEGPKIIEIGARIGGFRPRMYEQAYGIDLYSCALHTARGQAVSLVPTRQLASTVIELFPEKTGIFRGLTRGELLGGLPSLKTLKLKTAAGQKVGKASDGFRAAAIINLAGSLAQVERDSAVIRKHIAISVS